MAWQAPGKPCSPAVGSPWGVGTVPGLSQELRDPRWCLPAACRAVPGLHGARLCQDSPKGRASCARTPPEGRGSWAWALLGEKKLCQCSPGEVGACQDSSRGRESCARAPQGRGSCARAPWGTRAVLSPLQDDRRNPAQGPAALSASIPWPIWDPSCPCRRSCRACPVRAGLALTGAVRRQLLPGGDPLRPSGDTGSR